MMRSCKTIAAVQITAFLAACVSQSPAENLKMANPESTGPVLAADAGYLPTYVDGHGPQPTTHAAIGEFADQVRGAPLDLGYESGLQ